MSVLCASNIIKSVLSTKIVSSSKPSEDIMRYVTTMAAVTKDEAKFMHNEELLQLSDHQVCFCPQEPIYENGVIIIGYKTYYTETCKRVTMPVRKCS